LASMSTPKLLDNTNLDARGGLLDPKFVNNPR
jgi:hypothetical protein